ncbi:MAG TPA: PAS domain-containing protein [Aliidongia sp.]|nr:PAS domain-containing protein [Aliidongia sp.]
MIPGSSILNDLPEQCGALLTYWDGLRGDRIRPERREIDPGAIKSILPFIYILEAASHGEVRFRLAGTALRDLFGFELSGRNHIELAPPAHRRLRSYRMWTHMHHPCGACYSRRVPFSTGIREFCHGILLPLASDHADGPPLAIAIEVPEAGPRWLNPAASALLQAVEDFAYFDIGAGVPDKAEPPDDWDVA